MARGGVLTRTVNPIEPPSLRPISVGEGWNPLIFARHRWQHSEPIQVTTHVGQIG
jgi:hypothetical protein